MLVKEADLDFITPGLAFLMQFDSFYPSNRMFRSLVFAVIMELN